MTTTMIDNTMSLYVAVVFSDTTEKLFQEVFEELGIGRVSHVDFVSVVPERRKAFVHFSEWFQTEKVVNFQEDLKDLGRVKVFYSDKSFWSASKNFSVKKPSLERKERVELNNPTLLLDDEDDELKPVKGVDYDCEVFEDEYIPGVDYDYYGEEEETTAAAAAAACGPFPKMDDYAENSVLLDGQVLFTGIPSFEFVDNSYVELTELDRDHYARQTQQLTQELAEQEESSTRIEAMLLQEVVELKMQLVKKEEERLMLECCLDGEREHYMGQIRRQSEHIQRLQESVNLYESHIYGPNYHKPTIPLSLDEIRRHLG